MRRDQATWLVRAFWVERGLSCRQAGLRLRVQRREWRRCPKAAVRWRHSCSYLSLTEGVGRPWSKSRRCATPSAPRALSSPFRERPRELAFSRTIRNAVSLRRSHAASTKGTLPTPLNGGSTVVEASPSLVYGAGLLIPLGVQPPRGFESLSLRRALVAQSGQST